MLLEKIKNRIGDFWWYSLIIFFAHRSGDAIQAFIGLWLVPKYVGENELGAILPLQNLCNFLTVPLLCIAVVFGKYVSIYAARGEYGKVKSFVRDLLLASFALFFLCILAAIIVLPHFYLRLKVVSGLLTVLIMFSGLSTNIWSLIHNALQGLKKFNAIAAIYCFSAPVRLLTLLLAMPIRPLSGYVLGQATPPSGSILIGAATLWKTLKSEKTDVSWRKDLPEIVKYFIPVFFYHTMGLMFASIILTVYRQRLPEIESAAYYILSRFAEVATYLGGSLIIVLFPIAAEAREKGVDSLSVLKKSLAGIALTTIALTIIFMFCSSRILSLTDTWRVYLPFAKLLPVMTVTMGLSAVGGVVIMHELARHRLEFMVYVIVVNVFWCAFLLSFTGYEFFRGIFSDSIIDWMASLKMASLQKLTWAGLVSMTIQVLGLPLVFKRR